MIKVNNESKNLKNYKYEVVFRNAGQYWYWGAYNDRELANEAAVECGGMVWTIE